MSWTLTGTAAKVTAIVGLRRRWVRPAVVAHAQARAQRGSGRVTFFSRLFATRIDRASIADRKSLEAARAQMGADAGVVERAVASGAPVVAVAALASAWEGLPTYVKNVIRDPSGGTIPGPVMWGKVRATQMDQRTCGAAVLSMVSLMSDPLLSLWLMTGRILAGHVPRELTRRGPDVDGAHTVEERWHTLQRARYHEVIRRALIVAPWPPSLGTPPWRIGAVARCAGVRWRVTLVDDTDPGEMSAMVTHASAALKDGIPVMVYSGGDLKRGVSKAVPRHVVLLTARTKDGFVVYEPGSGARHLLRDADFVRGSTPHPALGNWSRINFMVLPSPRPRHHTTD